MINIDLVTSPLSVNRKLLNRMCHRTYVGFVEFSSNLNVVAWKVFLMLFGCLRQNINHSSENLKVVYIKCSMCYAIIKYQFKTSELKNVEKLVKQTVQA